MKRELKHFYLLVLTTGAVLFSAPALFAQDDDIYYVPKKNTFSEEAPKKENKDYSQPAFEEDQPRQENAGSNEQLNDSQRQAAFDSYDPENFERPSDSNLYGEEAEGEGYEEGGYYEDEYYYDYGARLRDGSPAWGGYSTGYQDGFYTGMSMAGNFYNPYYYPTNSLFIGYGLGNWNLGLGWGWSGYYGYGWGWDPWYRGGWGGYYGAGWGWGGYWNPYGFCGFYDPYCGGYYYNTGGSAGNRYYGHRSSTGSSTRPETRGERSNELSNDGARLDAPSNSSVLRSGRDGQPANQNATSSPTLTQPRNTATDPRGSNSSARPENRFQTGGSTSANEGGNNAGRNVQEEKTSTPSRSSANPARDYYRPGNTRSDYKPGYTRGNNERSAGPDRNTTTEPNRSGNSTPRNSGYQYNDRKNTYNRPSNSYSRPEQNTRSNTPSSGSYSTPERSATPSYNRSTSKPAYRNNTYQRPSNNYSRPSTPSTSPARPSFNTTPRSTPSMSAPSSRPSSVSPRTSSPSRSSGARSSGSGATRSGR